MKVDIEEIGSCKTKMSVEVPREKVSQEMEKAYYELRKTIKVPGFRKGKVPHHMLKKLYKSQVESDVISKLVSDFYPKAVEKTGVSPVAYPLIDEVKLEDDKPLSFTAIISVKPEINLKNYTGFKLIKEQINIMDKDIEASLKDLQDKFAEIKTLEEGRAIRKGDFAIIDFKGFLNGAPLEGGDGQDYTLLIGSNAFISGFEDQLIGLQKGEEKEFDLVFPEDYPAKELAKKEVLFKVIVKEIKEKILPQIDDKFAKNVGDYKTLNELKAKIKNQLEQVMEEKSKTQVTNILIDKLNEVNVFEVPEVLIDGEIDLILLEEKRRLISLGLETKDLAQDSKSLKEEDKEKYKKVALNRVKTDLILEEISKKENIDATIEELSEEINRFASQVQRDPVEFRREMIKNGRLEDFKRVLRRRKTVDFLLAKSEIEKKEIEGDIA